MMSFESTVRPAPQSPRRAPTPHPALVQDEGKSFHCTSRPVRSKCPSLTRAPDYKCPCDNDDHQPFGAGGELYPRYLNLQDGRVLLTFTVRKLTTSQNVVAERLAAWALACRCAVAAPS